MPKLSQRFVILTLQKYWYLFLFGIFFTLLSADYLFRGVDKVTLPEYSRYDQQEIMLTVPPFQLFERRFRTSPKHKINACVIEKNTNTVLTGIMCYLYNPERFKTENRNVNTEVHATRLCEDQNEPWFFMNGSTDLREINEWLHLAISRDPFERFISGFVDKCIIERTFTRANRKTACNGCGSSIVCFIHREYDRMMRFARGEPLNSFDDRHFFPQNWRCDFKNHFNKFKILRYSSSSDGIKKFWGEFFDVLQQRNVSSTDIDFLKGQVFGTRTVHATSASAYRKKYELRVRRDPLLMRMLIRMYYYDWLIFNYPLPEV
ncbi:hypothetical protein M3Y95_00131700 [Aphelenchoides besseyi]|nr:hypothetical protein M3Y95_00131700 [Aphelenchoides besseyi]